MAFEMSEETTIIDQEQKEIVSDELIELWFKHDEFKPVDSEMNIYPNISVFNRKIYTFGRPKEVFLKFSRINKAVASQDEIAWLDTRSCMLRVSQDRFIVVFSLSKGEDLAVLGELSSRYIAKNDLAGYGSNIYKAAEFNIVSVNKIYDPTTLTLDTLIEGSRRRIAHNFDEFIQDIREYKK